MSKDIVIPSGQEFPSQAAWDEMVQAADRVQILEDGTISHIENGREVGRPLGTKVLFESRRPEDLESLRTCVRFRDDTRGGICMCMGSLAFVFFRGKEQLAVLGFHHGESFRWDRWFGDGPLAENQGILDWLKERGIPGPALEVELVKQLAALQKMYSAAPLCLAPLQGTLSLRASHTLWVLSSEKQHLPPPACKEHLELLQQKYPLEFFEHTLEEHYPNPRERALLLFRWYGHFRGLWENSFGFEAEPATLLLHMPLDILVQALERVELSAEELEGAAHLFGSSQFAARFGPAWQCVPEPLIQRLLEHARQTSNRDIAVKAFLPQK